MRRLKLPVDYTATNSLTIEVKEDGSVEPPSPFFLDEKSSVESTKRVYQNAALVIWSALGIEKLLNRILLNHYFPLKTSAERHDFVRKFIDSGAISFNAKRRVVYEIACEGSWVNGKEKNFFDKCLAKVEEYRNAFAHGHVSVDINEGPTVTYFRGNIKSKPINADLLGDIERHFNQAFVFLKKFLEKHQGEKV